MAIAVPLFLFLIGLLFASVAIGLIRFDRVHSNLPKMEVQATVIGHIQRRDHDDSSTTYAAIYRFSTPSGQTLEVTDPVSRNFALDEVGSLKLLSYPLGHPEKAAPPRPGLMRAIKGFVLVLGLGSMAGGVYAFLVGPQGW